MGFFKKLELHVHDKFFATTWQGVKVGMDLAENRSDAVKFAAFTAGGLGGSIVGSLRLASPAAIADSILTSEDEMEERVQKKLKAAGLIE
jgi:hypothetical protein